MMKTFKSIRLVVVLSILFLNLSGCSRTGDRPELGQVTGTITMDDKPLYGTTVVFYPDKGRPARGRTDFDGKYELTYIRKTPGTKIGHNRVEIAPNEEEEEDFDVRGDAGENTGDAKPSSKSEKVKVPARYNTKSELQADVKPGKNVFDFKLDSKPTTTESVTLGGNQSP